VLDGAARLRNKATGYDLFFIHGSDPIFFRPQTLYQSTTIGTSQARKRSPPIHQGYFFGARRHVQVGLSDRGTRRFTLRWRQICPPARVPHAVPIQGTHS